MLRDVGSNKHSLIEVSFKSESGKCGQTGQSMAGIVDHVLVFFRRGFTLPKPSQLGYLF